MADADRRPPSRLAESLFIDDDISAEDEAAMAEVLTAPNILPPKSPLNSQETSKKRKPAEDDLGEGVMAALSKLRKENG